MQPPWSCQGFQGPMVQSRGLKALRHRLNELLSGTRKSQALAHKARRARGLLAATALHTFRIRASVLRRLAWAVVPLLLESVADVLHGDIELPDGTEIGWVDLRHLLAPERHGSDGCFSMGEQHQEHAAEVSRDSMLPHAAGMPTGLASLSPRTALRPPARHAMLRCLTRSTAAQVPTTSKLRLIPTGGSALDYVQNAGCSAGHGGSVAPGSGQDMFESSRFFCRQTASRNRAEYSKDPA